MVGLHTALQHVRLTQVTDGAPYLYSAKQCIDVGRSLNRALTTDYDTRALCVVRLRLAPLAGAWARDERALSPIIYRYELPTGSTLSSWQPSRLSPFAQELRVYQP